MTCLIGEAVDGPRMKSHTSMLEMFFVYTLALCTPIFKKKSPLKRLGKSYKLFIVVGPYLHLIGIRITYEQKFCDLVTMTIHENVTAQSIGEM